MWYCSLRLFGLDLCLVRASRRFTEGTLRWERTEVGEIYLYWLDFELVMSAWRRVERRLSEARRTESGGVEFKRRRCAACAPASEDYRRIS